MPVVPFTPGAPAPLPQPDDVYVDMAAALIKTERQPKEPTK
jgi:hypothetical protein